MNASAENWIHTLSLIPHPEGGYFREVFRSSEGVAGTALPGRYGGYRSFMTSIYFLIPGDRPALLHRVQSDELWVFLDGAPLTIHTIHPSGEYQPVQLGRDPTSGQTLQYTVPGGVWFGETVHQHDSFSLVACIVAPGFDYADFQLADRTEMLDRYPHLEQIILQLTLPAER